MNNFPPYLLDLNGRHHPAIWRSLDLDDCRYLALLFFQDDIRTPKLTEALGEVIARDTDVIGWSFAIGGDPDEVMRLEVDVNLPDGTHEELTDSAVKERFNVSYRVEIIPPTNNTGLTDETLVQVGTKAWELGMLGDRGGPDDDVLADRVIEALGGREWDDPSVPHGAANRLLTEETTRTGDERVKDYLEILALADLRQDSAEPIAAATPTA